MASEDQGSSSNEGQNQRQTESLLLALPSELIRLICAQLCSHCCGLTPMHIVASAENNFPLKALSETCTTLRDIAQPLLYHVPYLADYTCFLRAIQERLDLADSVKCLLPRASRLRRVRHSFNDHTLALMKEMAAELQMITAEDVPFEEEFPDMLALLVGHSEGEHEGDERLAYRQMEHFFTLLDAILVASLPCLEMLATCNWENQSYYPPNVMHHANRRLARVGRLVSHRCAGTTIPSLHTIIMDGWGENNRWLQTHRGVHLEPHEFLFSCASALTQLIFVRCLVPYTWPEAPTATNSSIWSTLPYLKSIVFEEMDWGSCAPWGYHALAGMHRERSLSEEHCDTAYLRIRKMAMQCRRLESFKISIISKDFTGAFSLFAPGRLVQSLLPTAERLETLMVHTESVMPRVAPALLVGSDMHSFTKLQELSLDEMCFCHHWYHYNSEGGPGVGGGNEHSEVCLSNRCLVDVLPSSVSFLNIRLRQKPRATLDLVHLGIAAAAGKFPSLKHVTVEAYRTAQDDAMERMLCSFYGAYRSPDASGESLQTLTPKLAEAFRGSRVAVEVMSMRIRRLGGTSFRPALS